MSSQSPRSITLDYCVGWPADSVDVQTGATNEKLKGISGVYVGLLLGSYISYSRKPQ